MRLAPPPLRLAATPAKASKEAAPPAAMARAVHPSEVKVAARDASKGSVKVAAKIDTRIDAKPDTKPDTKPATKTAAHAPAPAQASARMAAVPTTSKLAVARLAATPSPPAANERGKPAAKPAGKADRSKVAGVY
ncbi:hypothetical protein [Methylobacterium sp. Leaf118]|uniref:hypothetical protein n=1 Tax=Methylobacterium sp. Leaf118 TaxID=2876562 RepID=UPI003FA5D65C